MVHACVRKVGAIGIFFWVEFPDVHTKTEWYNTYGINWELYCFEKGTPE